jgi:hypothetical protein
MRGISLLVTLFLFVGSVFTAHSQSFSWREPNQHICYKIDFATKHLWESFTDGKWNDVGEIALDGIRMDDLYEVSDAINPVKVKGKSGTYLVLECSGQVYHFDRTTKKIRREDRTFFRGANCQAVQFSRNGEIFSFGGYGFWQSTNIITQYNFIAKEWTHVLANGEIPKEYNKSSMMYFPALDKLFVAGVRRINQTESADPVDVDYSLYQYDFNQKSFARKGEIYEPLFQKLNFEVKQNFTIALGRYWIIAPHNSVEGYNHDVLYIIDVEDNFHCYLWQNPARFQIKKFTYDRGELFKAYVKGQSLFLPQAIESSPYNPFQLVELPIKTLLAESISLGYLLEKPWWITLRDVGLVFVAVLLLFISARTIYFWRKRRKKAQLELLLGPNEKQFLDFLLINYRQGYVSGYQIVAFFGKHKSSPESQRQFRAKLIDGLNKSLGLLFPGEQVLDIQADDKDQRMLTYRLTDTIYQELNKL